MKLSFQTDLANRQSYGDRMDSSPRGDQDKIQSQPSAIVEAIRRKGALATSCVLGRCGLTLVVQIIVPDALSAEKLAAYLEHHGLATAPCLHQSHTQGSWRVRPGLSRTALVREVSQRYRSHTPERCGYHEPTRERDPGNPDRGI